MVSLLITIGLTIIICMTLLTIWLSSIRSDNSTNLATLPKNLRGKMYRGFDKQGKKRLIAFPDKQRPVLRVYKGLSKSSTSLWTYDNGKIKGGFVDGIEFRITQVPTLNDEGKEWIQVEIKSELIDLYLKED